MSEQEARALGKLWLDDITDPHNEIGWVVDVADSDIPGGESDSLTVAEAIELCPDRREGIIRETRGCILAKCDLVTGSEYPPEHWAGMLEALGRLARELEAVAINCEKGD